MPVENRQVSVPGARSARPWINGQRGASHRRTGVVALLCAWLMLGAAPGLRAQSAPLEELSHFPRSTLDIGSGKHPRVHYEIWIADTPSREEQGLMFVRDLPHDQAMLFPLDPPRSMTMWMKNTYIGLDIVFIGPDGHISSIIEHAVPHSLKTLASSGPVSAVLEIGGGESQRLGIKVGDEVHWSTQHPG